MGSNNHELLLPELFQLECIENFHHSLTEQHHNSVLIDGSQVTKVDTAGIQLLLSLHKELSQASGSFQWKAISEPLKHAIETMGLSKELATESH